MTTISLRLIATIWQIAKLRSTRRSGTSMHEHWPSGYEDTKRTITRRDWMSMPPAGAGILVHDVPHQQE